MDQTVGVRRDPIVDQLQEMLSTSILEGRLEPSTRLNEVHLAEQHGVSRTPLREALSRLRQTGLVFSRPNRGFYVAPVSSAEAGDLYPLLAMLEADALELAPPISARTVETLERLNDALGQAGSPREVIASNTAWHRALVGHCPNITLLELIENVRTKLLRYEFRFFAPGRPRVLDSMQRHNHVLEAVARHNRTDIRRALIEHWKTDLDELMPDDPPAADRRPTP